MQCNFSIMGKGGVGKSFISWWIAQYFLEKQASLYCADTDPTNATFSSYPALNAEHINISDGAMNIDKAKFDDLVERLMEHEGVSVVDTGSPSFLPMMSYLSENRVFELLQEHGRQVVVHTPIVGGPALGETLLGFKSMIESTTAQFVVWENNFFGPVDLQGQSFIDSKTYAKYRDRIIGVIRLRSLDETTWGKDLRTLLSKRLTFSEASDHFRLMQQQRLIMIKRSIYEQLDLIGIAG